MDRACGNHCRLDKKILESKPEGRIRVEDQD
jgi:hypothetical protein